MQYVFPIVIIVEPALLLQQQQSVQPNQKQEGQTKLRLQGSCTTSVLAGMAEGSTKIGGHCELDWALCGHFLGKRNATAEIKRLMLSVSDFGSFTDTGKGDWN